MSKSIIHGIYDDGDQLREGALLLRSNGIGVKEVFSPFPIHGIDAAIGVPRTRIAITAFIYGITGTALGTLMMWYMMIHDWPTNVGGKPNWQYFYNMPAFIPITFECTVLCAAHLMFWTFLFRSWVLPGVSPKNPDPRTTDDKFLMLVEANEGDTDRIMGMLKQTGASEVNLK